MLQLVPLVRTPAMDKLNLLENSSNREKDERMRRIIEAQIKAEMEMNAKDEQQKRLKRQWQEKQQKEIH